ncbi:hypothetical protein DFQ04_1445 [Algoriphagus boseongensis]|uniref:UDP-N-acetylglucosamine:LPS N-acetylglucosamine transferase n=1 Tax=Algoriphagus boseongensis TaxID=1442587 RepID=A0A4R6T9Y1_9BACT|nr:hypothetical protein [Algoriphagus boseongensis]TDQ19621.1 hypothetical protein DFQ04_1445 [Algoriphagus boseongensis]
MKKICFLIPDGVGIRNYLYSGVLSELRDQNIEVHIWHSLDEEVIAQSERITGFRPYSHQLKVFTEDAVTQILRESVSYARLKYNIQLTENSTLMLNWSFGNPSFQKRLLIKMSEFLGTSMRSYDSILSVEGILWKKLRGTASYKYSLQKLKEIGPDILFCTHQRMPGASAAMLAAQDLGILTSTAIFSWDNLPKARLAMRTDYYFVWSDYMKEELSFYYPEIPNERILVTGTPQFDFYSDPNLIQSREEFAAQFGLDPKKNWICFSGDDVKTSPFDHDYLRNVAESLQKLENVQIIFRQVPVEGTSRYDEILKTYPQIIHINPFWKKGQYWQQFFPYPQDLGHLVNLAYHCDTVINLGSTMALDFAFFDKPALYLNYDHYPDQDWTVKDIYRFQHFKSMENLDPVGWINSKEEIREKVEAAISTPSKIGKDRKLWLERIVQPAEGNPSYRRISDFFSHAISKQNVKA